MRKILKITFVLLLFLVFSLGFAREAKADTTTYTYNFATAAESWTPKIILIWVLTNYNLVVK